MWFIVHSHVTFPPNSGVTWEMSFDIFEYNGIIKERFSYGQICSAPPAID